MKLGSITRQVVIGALLALTLGSAGAATTSAPKRQKLPPLSAVCGAAFSTCMFNGKPIHFCTTSYDSCMTGRFSGAPGIGANIEAPAPTLQDLSPDADFHAAQFRSLVANAKAPGAPSTVKAGLTPAQCYQLYKACNNWRGSISKCIQAEAKCSTP